MSNVVSLGKWAGNMPDGSVLPRLMGEIRASLQDVVAGASSKHCLVIGGAPIMADNNATTQANLLLRRTSHVAHQLGFYVCGINPDSRTPLRQTLMPEFRAALQYSGMVVIAEDLHRLADNKLGVVIGGLQRAAQRRFPVWMIATGDATMIEKIVKVRPSAHAMFAVTDLDPPDPAAQLRNLTRCVGPAVDKPGLT